MDSHSKSSEPLVQLEGVGVLRSGRHIVRSIDLSLCRSQIVTLIGPNGSGKTTIAKLVAGIIRPDEGNVRRGDAIRVGYVPQKLHMEWTVPLTVGDFMNLTMAVSADTMRNALATTGVGHLEKARMHDLSGGEFQRVQLARAFARKPDLLILDEPLQGVDIAGESQLYRQIAEFRDKTGCAVLLVSHDLHMVMASTDLVVCLNGHICCSGTPDLVAASAEYQALFGPVQAGTHAVYRHHHNHTHLPDGRVRHADGTVTDDCNEVPTADAPEKWKA